MSSPLDLRCFRLLEGLTDPQRRAIVQVTRVVTVRRRHPIYRPGDPSHQIFFLKAGVVKIATLGPGDRESILGFRHPGDAFGELAIVDESPRDHLAEAHEDAVLYATERGVFLQLLRQSPDLSVQVLKLLAWRLQRFQARVEHLLSRNARVRVVHALLDLAADCSIADADGVLIPLRVTQRDLANLAGLTRETVNFALHDLKSRGWIEADRHCIRLRDPDALRSIA